MINRLNALLLAGLMAFAQIAPTWAQQPTTASLLPNGVQQFFTPNGKPISNGSVTHYVPSTTTPKTTWQDSAETTPWPTTIPLNSGGFPASGSNIHGIYGDGSYRQIVKDQYNNVIWDVPTASASGSGGGGGPSIGDGQLPGAMQPWAGFVAPPNWAFAFGQALSRTTYSNLLANITYTSTVVCGSGSPTITAIADTSQITVGAAFEASCATPGLAVVSKTASTVTLNGNANVSGTVTGTFFPWGDGDQATTFNVPDMRGVVAAGRPNMGGTNRNNLTATYFGVATDGIGPTGGSQSITLAQNNIPPYTPTGSVAITDPGHTHTLPGNAMSSGAGATNGTGIGFAGNVTNSAFTGITAAYTGTPQGSGKAAGATIAKVGAGYTNGTQTLTVVGGTCSTPPQFTVTVSGNVLTGSPTLLTAGACSILPASPAATTGGGGSGGTLSISWSLDPQVPFSTVQPTTIVNWIIKVLPDTSASIATGVSSLGGMTGVLACGAGLSCTSNTVNVVSGAAAGSDTQVQVNSLGQLAAYPTLTWLSPTLTIGLNGTASGKLALAGSTSGLITQTAQAVAGTPTVTWGTASGTPAVTASSPLAITSLTGNITCTTCGVTTSPLSQFAATTSAQLLGIISDETGTGSLVFSNSPQLVTPNIGAATASGLLISSPSATQLAWVASSGGTDAKTWDAIALTNTLAFRAINDAATVVNPWLNVTRSGATIAGVQFPNSAVTLGTTGTLGGSVIFSGLTSGTTTLNASAAATGTLTLPSATDTLMGRATTDTLTNKTFDTAATGNVFKINGTQITANTGSGANVLATSPTLVTPTLGAATATSINGIGIAGTNGTTMTFPAANANVASLNLQGQAVSGGAFVTPFAQGTGSLTVNCGLGALQFQTNNGAYTITAAANDGSCMLLVTNGASAGTVTFSGFSQGANSGDTLTTTNGSKFTIQFWRINGTSGYRVAAHQ